jgi:hypothetical protein
VTFLREGLLKRHLGWDTHGALVGTGLVVQDISLQEA